MSVPKSKRKPSSYEMVDIACKINECVDKLYYKMYDYSPQIAIIELGKIRFLADEIKDYTMKAQQHPLLNPYSRDTFVRSGYLLNALESLNSLDAFLNSSLLNLNHLRVIYNGKERGVKTHELEEILEYEIKLTEILSKELNLAKNKPPIKGYSL